ncbi:hypothetical protein U1Q18_032814 [Sarracenia purpurea var. burkii]
MERSHRRKEDQNPSKNLQQQHNNNKQEPEHERPQTATGTQKKLNNGRNRSVELAKPTQARNRTKSQHIPNRGQPEPKHNNPECNTSSRDEIEPKTKQAPRSPSQPWSLACCCCLVHLEPLNLWFGFLRWYGLHCFTGKESGFAVKP